MLARGRSRSKTASWPSAAKETSRLRAGSSKRPENRWAYASATRSGVSIRPSRSGSSPMASRISRTARSMRAPSMSSGIPLPLDDRRQTVQVGDDERSLRRLDSAPAVHEHRVQAGPRSSLYVGDGIVADVYYPVAGDAACAQRFLEDLTLGLLDPNGGRCDHTVEVAGPAEVVEYPYELDVPVGDREDFCPHLPQPAQHRLRLG